VRELVKEGRLSINTVDQRVKEVLRVKFQLGLFDHPYVQHPEKADALVHTAKDEAFAEEINRQSLVLLKNSNNTLPLDQRQIKKILVTGPLAAAEKYAVSRYGPNNNQVTTILDGIKKQVDAGITVVYEKGCEVTGPAWPESEYIPTPLSKEEQFDISKAVAAAGKADVIIAAVGEDEKTVGEGLSRTSLDLPGRQQQLLEALYATGKPVILVLINGQPLTINWADKYLPAILDAGFPGPSSGKVIAEALFGAYNPGGKLSNTFPKTVGQIEYNFPFKPASQADQPAKGRNGAGTTGANGQLYPFGYGLSYTSFGYSNLHITPLAQHTQGNIEITVDVTNTGKVKGDEVVQLYVKDKLSSVITYEMLLRGFERITLLPGEKKTVSFLLQPDDLALLDKNMNWIVEPGEFEVMIGKSSVDIAVKQTFTILPDSIP
jgi:beta-glucosidase